ncbi:MAG: polysaccharide biosynthesis/export family protein [Thermoanaerobaculia bacterium]|nr:polysaccharide biosynthesis/export family protein [Thermoanaerobaculia bacterium]
MRPPRGLPVLWIVLSLLVSALPAGGQTFASGYRIGPKDVLGVKVLEASELNVERRVADDGTIDLPRVGAVSAVGLTAREFAARLRSLLEEKYFQQATVEVEVLEFRSRPIVVIGAVRSPGNLAFSGRWTLLEALTAAGGLAGEHGGVVHVVRRAENGLSDQITIRVDDLLVKADPRVNIPIFANDLVNVPAAASLTVYFLGEVATKGAVSLRSVDRASLLVAVARAGGLTDRASSEILIKRKEPDGRTSEIKANFKRVLSGRDPDPELQDGDVIVVKEAFF